jgi:hypothetical protein
MQLTAAISEDAAAFGRLEMLRYCHDHGCPWGDLVCTCAAQAGHLQCLKYAVEHGCPYDLYQLCDAAQSSKSQDIIEYVDQLEERELDDYDE